MTTMKLAAGVPYYVALRHGPYKHSRYLGADEPEEPYDLHADPEELVNLADRNEHRKIRDRLHGLLRDELRRCDADFLDSLDRSGAIK